MPTVRNITTEERKTMNFFFFFVPIATVVLLTFLLQIYRGRGSIVYNYNTNNDNFSRYQYHDCKPKKRWDYKNNMYGEETLRNAEKRMAS